ncbi:MAG: hypothetical protein Q7S96_00055 [bacterium]|nr:hypothetical protein [bacterium]
MATAEDQRSEETERRESPFDTAAVESVRAQVDLLVYHARKKVLDLDTTRERIDALIREHEGALTEAEDARLREIGENAHDFLNVLERLRLRVVPESADVSSAADLWDEASDTQQEDAPLAGPESPIHVESSAEPMGVSGYEESAAEDTQVDAPPSRSESSTREPSAESIAPSMEQFSAYEELDQEAMNVRREVVAGTLSIQDARTRVEEHIQNIQDKFPDLLSSAVRLQNTFEGWLRRQSRQHTEEHTVESSGEPLRTPEHEGDAEAAFDVVDAAVVEAAGPEAIAFGMAESLLQLPEGRAELSILAAAVAGVEGEMRERVDATIAQLAERLGLSQETVAEALHDQQRLLEQAIRREVYSADAPVLTTKADKAKFAGKTLVKLAAYAGAGMFLASAAVTGGMTAALGGGVIALTRMLGIARKGARQEAAVQEQLTATREALVSPDGAEQKEKFERALAAALVAKRLDALNVANATELAARDADPTLTPEQQEQLAGAARGLRAVDGETQEQEQQAATREGFQPLRETACGILKKIWSGGDTADEKMLTAGVFGMAGALAYEVPVIRNVLGAYGGIKAAEALQKMRGKRAGIFGRIAGAAMGAFVPEVTRGVMSGAVGRGAGGVERGIGTVFGDEGAPVASEPSLPKSGPGHAVGYAGGAESAESPSGATEPPSEVLAPATMEPVAAPSAPEESVPAPEIAPSPPQPWEQLGTTQELYDAATFTEGQGFTHPVYDQLRSDPSRFGFTGNLENQRVVDRWAMRTAQEIAIREGFLEPDRVTTTHGLRIPEGGDVRIIVHPDQSVSYVGGEKADLMEEVHHVAERDARTPAAELLERRKPFARSMIASAEEHLRAMDAFHNATSGRTEAIGDMDAFRSAFDETKNNLDTFDDVIKMLPPEQLVNLEDKAVALREHLEQYRPFLGSQEVAVAEASSVAPSAPPPAELPIAPSPAPEAPADSISEPPPARVEAPMPPPLAAEDTIVLEDLRTPPPEAPAAPTAPQAPAVEASPARVEEPAQPTGVAAETTFRQMDSLTSVQTQENANAFFAATGLEKKIVVLKDLLGPGTQRKIANDLSIRLSNNGKFLTWSENGREFKPLSRLNLMLFERKFRA